VKAAKLPVMVWIYGGAYIAGAGDSFQTRGDDLVKRFSDVIVVTFNYRLGVLGWLGSERLRAHTYKTTGVNSTGNMGLMDMVQVLTWVKDNAANFGGDPNNVMIFGESAGAGAVSALMASPLSKGLFHKAVMESGGFQQWTTMTMAHAEGNMAALVKYFKTFKNKKHKVPICQGVTDPIECLFSKEHLNGTQLATVAEDDLTKYEGDHSFWDGYLQDQWGPIVDGYALLQHPLHALQSGNLHQVPVIIGSNKDEGTEFMDSCPDDEGYGYEPTCNLTKKVYNKIYNSFDADKINKKSAFPDGLYRTWLGANFGSKYVEDLHQLYNSSNTTGLFGTNYWAAEWLMGDFIMTCTTREVSRLMKQTEPNTYQYYFKHHPNSFPFTDPYWNTGAYGYGDYIDDGFGACHGCEIPFVFYKAANMTYGLNGTDELNLGMAMASYWTNFAWNSNPNDATGRKRATVPPTKWEAVGGSDATVSFDITNGSPDITLEAPHPRAHFCDGFWNDYFKEEGWFK